jgi:hypothetical protein
MMSGSPSECVADEVSDKNDAKGDNTSNKTCSRHFPGVDFLKAFHFTFAPRVTASSTTTTTVMQTTRVAPKSASGQLIVLQLLEALHDLVQDDLGLSRI